MLTRRIKRRMALLRIDEWRDYVEHLRETPDEVTALYQDLLIGVTSFFRDPDAFAALAANVLPKLVARASPEVPVRVWVPGCASGEEAYSIAILLIEQFRAADKAASVQIFATDIDERSLETARQGVYPGSIASALSPERLERFFVRLDEHRYQVSKELRDSIVVAPQSLTSDAPFSKLDLISCRNVLIYLEPGIQEKVISLLHFALKDDGYLLLGPAESIGRATGMFEAISKKWRLYRRIGPARRNLVSLPITATAERRRRAAPPAPTRRSPGVLAQMMQRLLAEDFAPAAALIDREYEILSVQGPLGDYLEFPRGEMTKDLLTMTRQGLRVKVRAVCEKALRESHTVIDAGARVRRNGHYVPCTVTARPVTGPQEAEGLLLIVFQDRAEGRHAEANAIVHDEGDAVVKQLEDDLRATRADLQSTIEDLESSNEELKASNEEIMSMNEELQSANDELETSKEELQSVNEELVTVNSQLQDKVEALDAANSDLTNLMAATDIAIIFLDTQLRIKRFTPPTARLLNLLATDIDRPFRDLSPRFEDRDLQRDMQRVLKTLKPIETTIHADQDLWYLRRIMPYRAGDNRVSGVVITFIDITGRLQADAHARRLATVLRDSNDAVVVCDLNGRITAWNRGAERAYGYSETEALELNMRDLIPSEREMSVAEIAERINRGEAIDSFETTRVTRDGRRLNVWVVLTALVDKSGKPVAIARTERDVTEQKALQKEILDIATVEQHRIGQELHDGTQQELTGLGLLAQHLSEALDDKSKEGELAAKLAAGIAETNRRVRALAQGVIPVAIDAEGLMAALGELAKSTEQVHGVRCRFECPVPVEVTDDMMATHLYRIGQEAVTNAIKHARAGVITIELLSDRGELKLEVRDDGIGIEESGARRQGLGLRIMDYRCALIGGELTVRRQEAGGTAVSCTVPPRAPADVARRTS
jgi:two-component system CheB/CheR fusion protein